MTQTAGPTRVNERGGLGGGVRCAHCSLPVPVGLMEADAGRQFCCHACRAAYEIIQSCDLSRFYTIAARDRGEAMPALSTGGGYTELDDASFAESHGETYADGTRGAEFVVEGMHCAACVWLIERVPQVLDGVHEARVDYPKRTVRLRWDPGAIALSAVAVFIDRLGYPVHPARERTAAALRQKEDREALVRIGVAGALAGNTMLIAFALYGGMFTGMDPVYEMFFRGVSAVLGLSCVVWPGAVFFRGAVASLRVRTLHMDVPIALALAAGTVHGVINTARAAGEIYFDTLAVLVFLLLVGRLIQSRQQRKAADAVELLYSLTPSHAVLVEGGGERRVAIDVLEVGDVVRVGAGESIPVDGVVVRGRSEIDVSFLTGESRAVGLGEGGTAQAGAVNLSSTIDMRTTATGVETRAGRLMLMVERCSQDRAPVVSMADRIAAWFVGAVIVVAVGTYVLWMVLDGSRAAEHAVSVLIVTCPCALGLATPMAVVVAIGRASRRGILIKGGRTLEVMRRAGVVVLDKTGTLTRGEAGVVSYRGSESARVLAAAAELGCNHPVARALSRDLVGGDARLPVAEAVHTLGGGVEADVGGRVVCVGSERFVRERIGGCVSAALEEAVGDALERGHTPILIGVDGEVVAVAAVDDDLRDGTAEAMERIHSMGWEVRILSGDHEAIVGRIGARLGVAPEHLVGGATPEFKARYIARLGRERSVVMVGDGVNDAAALASATVGVAVHGGAEASLAAADVYLDREGLVPLADLFDGSRRAFGVIRRNLAVSLAYNVVFASLAVSGHIDPLAAAVLMPISSLSVVLLSFRSRTF